MKTAVVPFHTWLPSTYADALQHVFQASPRVPEARVSLARLGQFIRMKTGDVAAPAPGMAAGN